MQQQQNSSYTIFLNLYDISTANKCLSKIGLGIFHSGVEIQGVNEYWFGSHHKRDTGVVCTQPKRQSHGPLFKSVEIGNTDYNLIQIDEIVSELKIEYLGYTYDIFRKNCHHFSADLIYMLTQKKFPKKYNRIAKIGNLFRCCFPEHFIKGPRETYEDPFPDSVRYTKNIQKKKPKKQKKNIQQLALLSDDSYDMDISEQQSSRKSQQDINENNNNNSNNSNNQIETGIKLDPKNKYILNDNVNENENENKNDNIENQQNLKDQKQKQNANENITNNNNKRQISKQILQDIQQVPQKDIPKTIHLNKNNQNNKDNKNQEEIQIQKSNNNQQNDQEIDDLDIKIDFQDEKNAQNEEEQKQQQQEEVNKNIDLSIQNNKILRAKYDIMRQKVSEDFSQLNSGELTQKNTTIDGDLLLNKGQNSIFNNINNNYNTNNSNNNNSDQISNSLNNNDISEQNGNQNDSNISDKFQNTQNDDDNNKNIQQVNLFFKNNINQELILKEINITQSQLITLNISHKEQQTIQKNEIFKMKINTNQNFSNQISNLQEIQDQIVFEVKHKDKENKTNTQLITFQIQFNLEYMKWKINQKLQGNQFKLISDTSIDNNYIFEIVDNEISNKTQENKDEIIEIDNQNSEDQKKDDQKAKIENEETQDQIDSQKLASPQEN